MKQCRKQRRIVRGIGTCDHCAQHDVAVIDHMQAGHRVRSQVRYPGSVALLVVALCMAVALTCMTLVCEGSALYAYADESIAPGLVTDVSNTAADVSEPRVDVPEPAVDVSEPTGDASDPVPAANSINILFVGNSLTHSTYGDVASSLKAIGEANGKTIRAEYVAFGGGFLYSFPFDVAGNPTRRAALKKKLDACSWDYIVLQEQSRIPSYDAMGTTYTSIQALRNYLTEVEPQAEVLLYMTHGFDKSVTSALGKMQLTASDMQAYTQSAYNRIGERLGLRVVKSGMYFQKYAHMYPSETLLSADKLHPSAKGYFVTACAFYEELYQEAPRWAADSFKATVPLTTQMRTLNILGDTTAVSPVSMSLLEGQTGKLNVSVPQGEPYANCFSLDPSIATLDSEGCVHAVSPGNTVVYVETASGGRATCAVSVDSADMHANKIGFPAASLRVKIGEETFLPPVISDSLAPCAVPQVDESADGASDTSEDDASATSEDDASDTSEDDASATDEDVTDSDSTDKPLSSTAVGNDERDSSNNTASDDPATDNVDSESSAPSVSKRGEYTLSWKISNPQIATINEVGHITTLKAGSTKVTMTATEPIVADDGSVTYATHTASYTLNVRLDAPATIKVTRPSYAIRSNGTSTLRVTWKKVPDASKYAVYRSAGSASYKLLGTTTKTTWVDKAAKKNTRMRYYVIAKGSKAALASVKSPVTAGIALGKPILVAKAQKSPKKIRISWTKTSAATGYLIYRAKGKSGAFKLIKTVKNNSTGAWIDTAVTRGVLYRYKVRSYRVLGGKTFYGTVSAVKSAKVEKVKSKKVKSSAKTTKAKQSSASTKKQQLTTSKM